MGSVFFHKASGTWAARGDIYVYCNSKKMAEQILEEMEVWLTSVKEKIRKDYPRRHRFGIREEDIKDEECVD